MPGITYNVTNIAGSSEFLFAQNEKIYFKIVCFPAKISVLLRFDFVGKIRGFRVVVAMNNELIKVLCCSE